MTIWVPAGIISTPGGGRSCKRNGNIQCFAGKSEASSLGKVFSSGMGASGKTSLMPQFPTDESPERQLYPAEYSVFLLKLPTNSCCFLFH